MKDQPVIERAIGQRGSRAEAAGRTMAELQFHVLTWQPVDRPPGTQDHFYHVAGEFSYLLDHRTALHGVGEVMRGDHEVREHPGVAGRNVAAANFSAKGAMNVLWTPMMNGRWTLFMTSWRPARSWGF